MAPDDPIAAILGLPHISLTPDDLDQPRCDFCGEAPIKWRYSADSFIVVDWQWTSVTDWAACDPCSELIEKEDQLGLLGRHLDQIGPGRRKELGVEGLRLRGEGVATLHLLFFAHRVGPRRPHDESEDPSIPQAIRNLPKDQRGLPIPFVALQFDDGREPDFRVLDVGRVNQCVQLRLCGICGQPLGYWIAFIGGPACKTNRLFRDPAMHPECAEYSARTCPFIAGSRTKYSSRPLPEGDDLVTTTDPNMAHHERRSEEMFIFRTRRFKTVRRHGQTYIESAPFISVNQIDSRR